MERARRRLAMSLFLAAGDEREVERESWSFLPWLDRHWNGRRKGEREERCQESVRWGRRGAYRQPRSTTIGIYCVTVEATPPHRPRWPRDHDPRRPELAGHTAPDPHRSELADHAAS
ncbi:hypothetical protein [Oryza sativa Japonica Group]|uniref:Uncharacterized protein n=1 Tax=Oryza sativa subsp. japonica TaxID=39947 RepID=Q9ARU7_ORYSJ|nr:hypothetical protein [Oryza sativa Japonica Group]BAB90589.1 hypothetical protein [Oryza sativa Japonica Group]